MNTPTSDRSWWGWGSSSDAVDAGEADALVARMGELLPEHDFSDHAPPDPRPLGVPAPRLTPPSTLAALFSVDRLSHARGKALRDVVRNLHGQVEHGLRPTSASMPRVGGAARSRSGTRSPTLLRTATSRAVRPALRATKHALDPAGILNPGVLLP